MRWAQKQISQRICLKLWSTTKDMEMVVMNPETYPPKHTHMSWFKNSV